MISSYIGNFRTLLFLFCTRSRKTVKRVTRVSSCWKLQTRKLWIDREVWNQNCGLNFCFNEIRLQRLIKGTSSITGHTRRKIKAAADGWQESHALSLPLYHWSLPLKDWCYIIGHFYLPKGLCEAMFAFLIFFLLVNACAMTYELWPMAFFFFFPFSFLIYLWKNLMNILITLV